MRLIDADALNIRSYCRWFDDPSDVRVVERMIREAPTIAPPPNDPLTLDELREMDGEPVWIMEICSGISYWAIVKGVQDSGVRLCTVTDPEDYGSFGLYGKTWLAYRRKPEEGG